ncbi:MAG: tail fiber domain-containing protein [Stellaceae bacterium]
MDTSDLSLKTVLQLPDAGALSGNEFIHLVQGSDPATDVKATLSFIGATLGTGLIYATDLADPYPSMAIGYLVDWPMSWRGMVCGYYAAAGGFQTDINLQQVATVSPDLVAVGATWEKLDHVAAFGERAGRGAWAYSATFLGQQSGYFSLSYAPVFVGRWAGFGAVGAQMNALGYMAGAYADGGYDSNVPTLTTAITKTQTGSVAVSDASQWSPAILGYANGTLFFRIDQEAVQGHYIDDTHISLDVRGAGGVGSMPHSTDASVLRFMPAAQCNFLGTEAGKYCWGGNNDLLGHQAGYQGSMHDSAGLGYHALYVATGYNHVGVGSRANAAIAGHDTVAVGAGATTQVLGTPFSVTTGPGNRTFDIANTAGQPSQNIAIPAGTGAANGWTSGETVNLMWNWPGTYAPVHLESTNTTYLFTYYKNSSTDNEYLLPSKQVWSWNGSATSDANPPDLNAPVGGNDTASWPSPENASVTLYQPVGTATFTPILGSNEATAIGSAAQATAQNALAVGANAEANQSNAVAIGSGAAATGDHASAIGTNAAASASYAQAIGYAAAVSGDSSVGVGPNISVSGTESVAIGKSASANAGDATAIGATASAGYVNSTAIGYGAATSAENSIVLGNGSITKIYAAVTAITAISDRRLKRDIADLDLGLDFVRRLRPVSYRLRHDAETERFGFIAQEVDPLLPRDRTVALREHGADDTWRLNYGELIAPMIQAIQELAAENTELRRRVTAIEGKP